MTRDQVLLAMREHLATKFPKTCRTCGRTYHDLKDYLQRTRHVGQPISLDVEMDNLRLSQPLGAMSLANCACGNTIAIDSEGMSLAVKSRLVLWLLAEMTRTRKSASHILEELRRSIDEATLSEV